jgi:hypothetical protein
MPDTIIPHDDELVDALMNVFPDEPQTTKPSVESDTKCTGPEKWQAR